MFYWYIRSITEKFYTATSSNTIDLTKIKYLRILPSALCLLSEEKGWWLI